VYETFLEPSILTEILLWSNLSRGQPTVGSTYSSPERLMLDVDINLDLSVALNLLVRDHAMITDQCLEISSLRGHAEKPSSAYLQ
jgi:hypothetical protein